jgi:hypothetical protein
MRDGNQSILGESGPKAPAKPAAKKGKAAAKAPEPVAVAPIQWFRITESRDVPRHGGSYHLHAGKEVNSGSYDIKTLQRAGVKMEPCEAPMWWVEEQHKQVAALEADESTADQDPRGQLAARGVPGLLDEEAPAPTT